MLFFDVLPFTTLAVSVNGKTSKKKRAKTTQRCLVCLGRVVLARFSLVSPFTDDAIVVHGKTSKKSVQKQRGGFWCVKTLRLTSVWVMGKVCRYIS